VLELAEQNEGEFTGRDASNSDIKNGTDTQKPFLHRLLTLHLTHNLT
jgi:hypothetical protein